MFIACGGVTVILRNLTAVKSARMAEALIGALLYLLNKPDTRLKARMNLDCLAAPFTDLHSVDKARYDIILWVMYILFPKFFYKH